MQVPPGETISNCAGTGPNGLKVNRPDRGHTMNYYNYYTEIEEHFVRRRGKHMFVSPMDWSLIATWRDAKIPLHVVLRGIDRAMDSYFSKLRQRDNRLSTLFYCHSSVMEEYQRHLESHLGEDSAADAATSGSAESKPIEKFEGPDTKAVLNYLNDRISEIKALSMKQSIVENVAVEKIERIVSRIGEISLDLESDRQLDYEALDRDLGILDESLIEMVRAALPADQITLWEQEAKKDLKVYRKKLSKDMYAKILENFLRAKIHRHFGVAELSISQI
jgi:hypothetical protein